MKESKLLKSLVASFVVLGLGAPALVLANISSHLEIEKVTVSYADLNLQNEAGVQALYGRLQRASNEVCNATSVQIIGTIGRLQVRNCYLETLAQAVDKVDNDNLTRIHAG